MKSKTNIFVCSSNSNSNSNNAIKSNTQQQQQQQQQQKALNQDVPMPRQKLCWSVGILCHFQMNIYEFVVGTRIFYRNNCIQEIVLVLTREISPSSSKTCVAITGGTKGKQRCCPINRRQRDEENRSADAANAVALLLL